MKNFSTKKHLLAVIIPVLMQQATAEETSDDSTEDLGVLTVTADKVKTQGKLGERTVTRKQLDQENIQNAQDLVRYNTEVDVAEVGRYGNKGFAVRGVDGNRVAMNIDGVALPEVEVNEIYSPYGYVYEGRFNPDVEIMGGVRVTAGADSLLSGSGAVGGSVAYRTKDPFHLVKDGNIGGYAKMGYTTKNEELLTATGIAGRYDKLEFVLNYAHRRGHELKNHDMKPYKNEREKDINYNFCAHGELGDCVQSTSALYPDSMTYKRDALLGKLYYNLNDAHRIGLTGLYQAQSSNSFAFSKDSMTGYRMTKDRDRMRSFGLNYRWQPTENRFIESLNTDYQYQNVYGLADTWVYPPRYGERRLDRREYRPVNTKTHQLKLDTKLLPIDLGKWGEHSLNATAIYRQQDYTATGILIDYNDITGKMTSAKQPTNFPYPDAKKYNVSAILQDNIHINDRLNAQLGLRYDYYQYRPYFENSVYFNQAKTNEQDTISNNYNSNFRFYKDLRNGVYNQKPSFKKLTYNGAFDYRLIPDRLDARYKIGTGFLAPTVTQMYSATQVLTVQQLTNTELKPETSLNQELEFEFNYRPVTVTASLYHSDYKNFIHTVYWSTDENIRKSAQTGCGDDSTSIAICVRSENLDKAEITGVKLGMRVDMSDWLKLKNKLAFTADYHQSKDKAEVATLNDGTLTVNTLASVPSTTILGLDYDWLDGKGSLHARAKFAKAKDPKDTKYVRTYLDNNTKTYHSEILTYKHAWRGTNAWTFDIFGDYKLSNNIKVQAGVYNLFNKKYIPWDTLRQFNDTSVNSLMDTAGHGFNRYTAPGRNYALSLTYEF